MADSIVVEEKTSTPAGEAWPKRIVTWIAIVTFVVAAGRGVIGFYQDIAWKDDVKDMHCRANEKAKLGVIYHAIQQITWQMHEIHKEITDTENKKTRDRLSATNLGLTKELKKLISDSNTIVGNLSESICVKFTGATPP